MKKFDKLINNKIRKYYYNFDYLMHSYVLRHLDKNIISNDCLELGAGFGNFTKLLSKKFKKITVVEGSTKSINTLKKLEIPNLEIIQQDLEKLILKKRYNNIFLIHTFEHLKERKNFLKNIKNNLSKKGKLFVVCPNAYAASRQIAVKMGLIKKETDVTAGERSHGHYVTHSMETLMREFINTGLKIVDHGGICFKPLANFQIDLAMKKKIIDKNYLEACFSLGKKYPELCSSIYVIAKLNGN